MKRVLTVLAVTAVCCAALNCAQRPTPAPSNVPSLAEQIEQLRRLQDAVNARLLTPPDDERQRLAEFLKQPDTGLIKLLPRGKYDDVVVGSRGGGAYYSFTRRTHEYGYGSDIELQNDRLTCGFAGADYGYFLPLGDVPIERAADIVAGAEPPNWVPREATRRWGEFWGNVPVNGMIARERDFQDFTRDGKGVPATPGNAYLLRSVSPQRSDVLVAFRVERAFEDDGSILISWKLLKEFVVPNLPGVPRPQRQ
jgi:hypothetical protein